MMVETDGLYAVYEIFDFWPLSLAVQLLLILWECFARMWTLTSHLVTNNSCPCSCLSQQLYLQISAPDVCCLYTSDHSGAPGRVPITRPQVFFCAGGHGLSQPYVRCGLPLWSDAAGAVVYFKHTQVSTYRCVTQSLKSQIYLASEVALLTMSYITQELVNQTVCLWRDYLTWLHHDTDLKVIIWETLGLSCPCNSESVSFLTFTDDWFVLCCRDQR